MSAEVTAGLLSPSQWMGVSDGLRRHAALPEREDLPHDGLRHRDDGAAAQALEDAHGDEELEIGGDAGQERAGREEHRADQEEAPPAADREVTLPAIGVGDRSRHP